jgi:P22 tail accessory factor
MSWTKRQIIMQALSSIGLASYSFDADPEQLQNACRRLDTMMATWNARKLFLSYPLPGSPENTDLDTESNIPDSATEAVYLNLAVRIAPSYGKSVMPETKQFAFEAFQAVLLANIRTYEQRLPGTMPAGAGNKSAGIDREIFIAEEDLETQPWETP